MINNYICALDIGSSKLVAAAALIKKGRIAQIFLENEPSRGIREGVIVDSVELVSALSRLMRKLRGTSGLKIKSVFANVSGQDIVTKHSYSVIPLAERGNKVISIFDMEKVNDQARILGSSLEEEIIHQIPFAYGIDSKKDIVNPLGLYSHRLEVDLFLVCAKISSLQALNRLVHQSGYDLKEVFLSGIASSCAVFNQDFKTGVNVFCDIGSDISELLIFKDGALKDIRLLRLGGDMLTQELSRSLNISLELAEDLKRTHAAVGNYEDIEEDKEILIKKDNLYKPIKQKLAAQITTDKTKAICEMIKVEAGKSLSLNEVSNFVVAGRSVLLEGFLEMLESTLGIPVKLAKLGHPQLLSLAGSNELLSGHKYLTYLTALGLICQALRVEELPQFSAVVESSRNPVSRLISRAKEVYQEYF